MRPKRAQTSVDLRISSLAARQYGVVSLDQLAAVGLSREQVKRRLRAGRLHSLHRGVYSVGHRLLSPHGRWLAAVLAYGKNAVLSHRAAAALWAVRASATPAIDVTVPGRSGRRSRDSIKVHRLPLPTKEVTVCDGIPVTTVARTLLDLAAVVPRDALKSAIDEAERLRIFDLRAVDEVLEGNPGRRGGRALREVLERYREPPFTRNDLERAFLALCAAHRLPAPAVNVPLHGYEIDFLWAEQRLAVETDGRETHLTRAAFEEDRERDARLAVLGYRVVRFTYRQVQSEPDFVAGVLRELLQPARSMSSTR